MDPKKTALERAFEMAESGKPAVEEIRRALLVEGYRTHELTGGTLLAQLRKRIQAARQSPAD